MVRQAFNNKIILIIILISGVLISIKYMNTKKHTKEITVAFGSPWKTITPYLQHTAIGDMVISNQFQSLIGYNETGEFVPLGAKSWEINDNFTVFKFIIDTSRTFSNGDNLTSYDYKKSWEHSLTTASKSTNKSLLDILYKIKGFENYEKTGHISGIQTPDEKTLIIEFVSPYRMALEFLTGSRFSAYKISADKYMGTGLYDITEINDSNLLFVNKIDNSKISVRHVTTDKLETEMLNGNIDIIHQAAFFNFSEDFFKNEKITIDFSNESRHKIIMMNTKTGIFSKKNNRRALQYLTTKYFHEKNLTENGSLIISPQYYVSFQKGRIEEEIANEIIESYSVHVDEFMQDAKKQPLIIYENQMSPIIDMFKWYNIPLSIKSKSIPPDKLFDAIYHPKEHDILSASASVNSGDPDGLYHLLGEKGAIANPYSMNANISKALEKGREIIDTQQLDDYYKKVSLLLLDEVPVVHIGFGRSANIYRNDKVRLKSNLVRRNDGHLDVYEPK